VEQCCSLPHKNKPRLNSELGRAYRGVTVLRICFRFPSLSPATELLTTLRS